VAGAKMYRNVSILEFSPETFWVSAVSPDLFRNRVSHLVFSTRERLDLAGRHGSSLLPRGMEFYLRQHGGSEYWRPMQPPPRRRPISGTGRISAHPSALWNVLFTCRPTGGTGRRWAGNPHLPPTPYFAGGRSMEGGGCQQHPLVLTGWGNG
jgi:hypothetical protein